ncbi:Protein of unknown function [Pseudonocardia ammonioxydans]|uniref:DUF3040 domain-containing protein n=1 Tax=Pseudonocardia ammonioxydans TaxID=260086 RepID=A0A1I5IA14_PSUAM|nr:DUF3040 domain-containing protein [Pseudonocardia ammonioxydans]SFO57040.1 Protein of unknown function [Pseudonocardia ammonioxydans]
MSEDRQVRPLDERERRILDEIARVTRRDDPDLHRLMDGTEGIVHPPARCTGTRVPWRVVLAVMLLAVLYAAVLVLLPTNLAVAVVIGVQLVLVPIGCLLWGRRHGEL